MQENWKALILRHKRENLKKCSLQPLVGRNDLVFLSYPLKASLPLQTPAFILSFDGPLISEKDANHGLILIDATWQLASKMEKSLASELSFLPRRSLPPDSRTAYPRKQTGCADPLRGLASVEALFIAYHFMGHSTDGLLDHYFWREEFLALNRFLG